MLTRQSDPEMLTCHPWQVITIPLLAPMAPLEHPPPVMAPLQAMALDQEAR